MGFGGKGGKGGWGGGFDGAMVPYGGGYDGGYEGGGMMDMMSMMMSMMGGDGKGMGKQSKAEMKRSNGEEVYYGTLRYFNAEKNSGYIYCKKIMAEHGQEVYAYRNILEECGAGLGDEIAFFLHWSGKGQAQASSPVARLSSATENNLVLQGTFKKPKDATKEFGFIGDSACTEFFGRDVYVPASLCEGLAHGSLVAFNVFLNKDGMPNCSIVCACEANYAPMPGDLSFTGEVPIAKGKGKGMNVPPEMQQMMDSMGMPQEMMFAMMAKAGGKGGVGGKGPYAGGRPTGSGKKPVGTGQFMTGTVKSFNQEKNYGFISSEDVKALYSSDVFCGGTDLAKYAVGSQVLFQLALSEHGKPQAIDVTPC